MVCHGIFWSGQFTLFLDSNRNGYGISTVNWQIAYHYAFDTPTGFFCQMVSTPGFLCQNHGTLLNATKITFAAFAGLQTKPGWLKSRYRRWRYHRTRVNSLSLSLAPE